MVGALALVTVRQQDGDAVLLAPLHLAGGDELVDDRLGAVDEVAELGFPDHKRVGLLDRIAVFEAERGVLGKQRVVGVEAGVVLRQLGDRQVLAAGLGVDDGGVPLHEGAAPGVLTGQPNGNALGQKRTQAR